MTSSLNFIDYFILIIMGTSILLGFIHGIVRSILSVCVWIGAVLISAFYGPHLATTFSLVTSNPEVQLWLSYGTVFLIVIAIGFVIKLILNLILTGGETSILNRFFGGVFGFIRGVLIVILFLWFAMLVDLTKAPAFENSQLTPIFESMLASAETAFPGMTENAQEAMSSMNASSAINAATETLSKTNLSTSAIQ